MRILFLGDIVGDNALNCIAKNIAAIKKENNINVVLANAENVCNGKGLNKKEYIELQKAGISALSMGNHTYSKNYIFEFINEANLVKPANMPLAPGKNYLTFKYNTQTITLISLLGRIFTNQIIDCPFKTLDNLLNEIKSDYIIVDFHAEATSEKQAFAFYFKDRVDAIIGTHTHVQTADERLIGERTLYITDVGMCGPYNSVIGENIDLIIERFLTGVYRPMQVATGPIVLNGVILDLDKKQIRRFNKLYNE